MDGWDRKLAEIRHGLKGQIVDGLLVRVSSVSVDSEAAFDMQDRFLGDVVACLDAVALHRLTGLN